MDLSKFDRQTHFSAKDIACLVGGLDPDELESDAKVERDFARVKRDSDEAVVYVFYKVPVADLTNSDGTPLFSKGLSLFLGRKQHEYSKVAPVLVNGAEKMPKSEGINSFSSDYMKWQGSPDSHIENLTFDRSEVARWLRTCEFKSEYSFEKSGRSDSTNVQSSLDTRKESAYLNAIAVLVELIQTPMPNRGSAAEVIVEMVTNYNDAYGISKTQLEKTFAAAKRNLRGN